MFRLAFLAAISLIVSLPAFAATDDEIAQKCVVGMKLVTENRSELTFLSGGNVGGSSRSRGQLVAIHGTWSVKNGVLSYQIQTETGRMSSNSHRMRLDETGKCYVTTSAGEKAVTK
jgi:hypothetical protein